MHGKGHRKHTVASGYKVGDRTKMGPVKRAAAGSVNSKGSPRPGVAKHGK